MAMKSDFPLYLSWSLVPDVEGHGEDEAGWVVGVVLHGALVPHLVGGLVIHLAEVTVKYTMCASERVWISCLCTEG